MTTPTMDALNKALIDACSHGDLTTAQTLLTQGADLNAHDGLPLRSAIVEHNLSVVQFLLESGADVFAAPEEITDNEDIEDMEEEYATSYHDALDLALIYYSNDGEDYAMLKCLIKHGAYATMSQLRMTIISCCTFGGGYQSKLEQYSQLLTCLGALRTE